MKEKEDETHDSCDRDRHTSIMLFPYTATLSRLT